MYTSYLVWSFLWPCWVSSTDLEGPFVSQKQVCDDISRRLALLQEQWAGGKLSVSVKKRMALLVQGMAGSFGIA